MAAAFPEISMGLSCDLRLSICDWFNGLFASLMIVKAASCYRIGLASMRALFFTRPRPKSDDEIHDKLRGENVV
jgi:hypothetical protein